MLKHLDLHTTPIEENYAQMSEPDYQEKAHAEYLRMVDLLTRKFGHLPMGARYDFKAAGSDFVAWGVGSSYYQLRLHFDEDFKDSVKFAYAVADNFPQTWDDDAKVDWKAKEVPVD
jgi:hypothetical protein